MVALFALMPLLNMKEMGIALAAVVLIDATIVPTPARSFAAPCDALAEELQFADEIRCRPLLPLDLLLVPTGPARLVHEKA
jgi:hypothetical protein